jgi:hypothetical protein
MGFAVFFGARVWPFGHGRGPRRSLLVNVDRAARTLRRLAAVTAWLAPVTALSSPTADGRIVYSTGTTQSTPQHRAYAASTNAFSAGAATVAGSTNSTFFVDRACPTRTEHVAGYVTTNGVLQVLRWNGTVWSAEWSVNVGGGGINGRRFDIVYESASGRAVVVYSTNGSGATAELAWRVWNGSTWTGAANLQSARFTGAANWVKLAPRVNGSANDVMLAAVDTNSRLTSFLWDGTTWGGEPTAAHSTAVNRSVAAGDLDTMDLAAESASGNFLLAWSDGANLNWREYTTGWQAVQTRARNAWHLELAADPDPASDRVLVAYNRSASNSVYASVWSGSALGAERTVSTAGVTPAVNRKTLAAAWLLTGSTRAAVVAFQDNTTTYGRVSYSYSTNDGASFSAVANATVSGPTSGKRWMEAQVDPRGSDTMLLTFSDGNGDLWAKRVVLSATPALAFTDADGGTALTTSLASTTAQNFAFAHDRFVPPTTTVSNGTNPSVTTPVAPGSAAQPIDAFDVQASNGTDGITALTVTFANATAQGVGLIEITDAGGGTVYGTFTNPADEQAITLGTAIPSTATLTSYRIRITPRAHSAMPPVPGASYPVTARITDVTVAGLKSVNDSASATMVVDNASSPNVTGAAATGGDGTVTASWTNPGAGMVPDADFAGYVVVLGNSVAVTGAPAEGAASYAPGQAVGADTVVCAGAISSCAKTGLGDSAPWSFRIFTRDGVNNWSAGVAVSGTSLAGPTHAFMLYTATTASTTNPRARGYWRATSTFDAAVATVGGGANQTFFVDRASPKRKEHVTGYVTTGGVLYVLRWNGTGWSAEWNVTVGGNGVDGRRFDIAYENASGDAVVVYSTNANGQVAYRVWNGSTWTGATTQSFARLTAPVNAVKLATRALATSDVIAATASDTSNNLSTLIWDGSGWGSEPSARHNTSASGALAGTAGQNDLWDHAYETASGDLLVVFTGAGGTASNQYYRTWSGGSWGTSTSFGGTARTPPMQMVAAADPDASSDRIAIAWNRTGSTSNYATVWSGAGLATLTNVGAGTNTAIHQRSIGAGWLRSGAASAALIVFRGGTAGDLGYNFTDDGGTSWNGALAFSPGGTAAALDWLALRVDPFAPERAIVAAGDANGDLWAKRAVWNGTALAWSDADGGAALTTALASTTAQNFDFAFDRYLPPAGTLTLANHGGTEASNANLCAAAAAPADLDRFTLLASGATNVTGVTPTFGSDPAGLLGLLEVTDDSGGSLGALSNPAGLTPAVTGMSFAAPTGTAAQLRLRVTPNAAATGWGSFTATVTAVATSGGFPLTGSDAGSATVIVDGAAPPDVTGASATPTVGMVTANWTNPVAGTYPATDFGNYVVVLGNTVAITGAPAKGTATYAPGAAVGADTVVCAGSLATCAKTGLGSSQPYYLEVFTRDGCANWSSGVQVSATTPNLTTAIADGTNPASAARNPGGAEAPLDAFTLQTNTGTDTVTALTVTLAAGTSEGLASVRIMGTSGCGGMQYGAVSNPASDAVDFTGLSIPVTTTAVPFYVCVTPLSHADMPSPPGAPYAVTGTVTAFTSTNPPLGSDAASATVTIDNASSPEVWGASATGGASTVTATWNNPPAGAAPATDFASYVVVLGNAVPVTAAPAEGTTSYASGTSVGADTVACSGSVSTCQKTGLGAGVRYFLRIFTRDATGNWSAGVAVDATTTDARTTPVALTGSATCSAATLAASYTGDTPTSNNRVTFARATAAGGPFSDLASCGGVGGGANPRGCVDVTVSEGQTLYYRATFTDADGVVGNASVDSGGIVVPPCAARLAVAPGSPMPPVATLTAGTSGQPVARISLTPVGGSVLLTSLAVENAASALPGDDVASLVLYDEATSTVVATAGWNGALSRYELKGFGYALSSAKTLAVLLSVAPGATAGRTFALRVPADAVTVAAPNLVDAYAPFDGNTFTVSTGGTEGNPNPAAPMVSIVNPMGGPVSGAFKVQIRVHNPTAGIAGIGSVALSTDNGASWPFAAARNARYDGKNATTFEVIVSGLVPGPYTLRARAINAVPMTSVSGAVLVTVLPARRGDGNLLVRDNSSQLCADCHALKTHSSESTSNTYGAWATACRDCHRPHRTRNVGLLSETITPPAVTGPQPARKVGFLTKTGDVAKAGWDAANGRPAAGASFTNGDGSGPCQVCHTRTTDVNDTKTKARFRNTGNDDTHYTVAAGTSACTDCHSHSNGFAAGEPTVPGTRCGGCHRSIFNMVKTGGLAVAHRIDLDQGGDTALDWSGVATLSGVAAAQRSCLNTCHADHPHDLTSPVVATHEGNVYADPLTNASRATASGTRAEGTNRARTDFDSATDTGVCAKCHAKPVVANGLTVMAAAYGASAHDYVTSTVGATTYAWTYPLHDGATFARNCTKCHATPAEGRTPSFGSSSTRALQTVHGSTYDSLLAGVKRPAGVATDFVCYNCHGSTASPAEGTLGNRSGRPIQGQVTKTYRHAVEADASHDGAAEYSGTKPATRHVSCMDCHDMHQASAANPVQGAPGIIPTNSTTPGNAPTAYTFTRVTAADNQYQTCFRCHTDWNGFGTGTNVAIEFNPNNDSLHFVEGDQGAVPVNTTGTGKGIWKNAQFNLSVVPTQGTRTYVQVMMPRAGFTYSDANLRSLKLRCSDCHGDNAADGGNAVPEGPHGSANARILKTPAGSPYTVWTATSAVGNSNVWCYNCHIANFTNSGFSGVDGSLHTSKHSGERCQDCHLANPHGQTGAGTAGQRKHLLKPATFTDAADGVTSGSWTEDAHTYVIPGCT